MRQYETLLLFSPELTADNRKEIMENLGGVVEREQGETLVVDEWGMRDLAYAVRKMTRGFYIRYEYAVDGAAVAELERIIRITDGIMKFTTVKLADKYVAEEE